MVKICFNKTNNIEINAESAAEAYKYVAETMKLTPNDFYLEQNGKRLNDELVGEVPVYVRLCVLGGKGGFGSMLRAIGAQIEKTTNREACRDLSGRRLRDINEEKRLKAWLEKQGEREREAEERKKRKIEKLLAVPKHEFKDEEYEEARSKLTEKVCDAVEEGFKKASGTDLKRKNEASTSQKAVPAKKKKPALWLDDDVSSGDDSESSDDDSDSSKSSKNKNAEKDSEDSNSNQTKLQDSDKDSNLDSGCDSVSSKQQL
ncbi:replication stress response regulator SDE2 [Lucilia sericata]|uniref:replication stress response regulator SDE2 n=1 Tax=Lucilia sericata TaxID=13632 RepID=UPI0018A81E09|nr:replication stress response regulator SDE2 [Lucilia sericata]